MSSLRKAGVLLALSIVVLTTAAGCIVSIAAQGDPAYGYVRGSGAPLRVAVSDVTGGNDWSPAVQWSVATYGAATPYLQFQDSPPGANIVVRVRRYSDSAPPVLPGYLFQPGVGGFATVYDANGTACNFPPAIVPEGCNGEITTAYVYLNDIIPPGADIETRRHNLILHELGHALGLTRHSPDLDISALAQRYGWSLAN
ncbi:MAG: hypothetical protein ACYDCT_01410 [Dehalococcoidia bacterium]